MDSKLAQGFYMWLALQESNPRPLYLGSHALTTWPCAPYKWSEITKYIETLYTHYQEMVKLRSSQFICSYLAYDTYLKPGKWIISESIFTILDQNEHLYMCIVFNELLKHKFFLLTINTTKINEIYFCNYCSSLQLCEMTLFTSISQFLRRKLTAIVIHIPIFQV